jgi:hypothetical protein
MAEFQPENIVRFLNKAREISLKFHKFIVWNHSIHETIQYLESHFFHIIFTCFLS